MGTKLNQIIAVTNGQKTRTEKALTEVYHKCQKKDLFEGLQRVYRPLDEEGEVLPPESKKIQYSVDGAVKDFSKSLGKLLDIVATQEYNNTEAKASVVVDGQEIVNDVPVTYLLFLEKQLQNVKTFVDKLPVLDSSETWHVDEQNDCWTTQSSQSNRTKKVFRNHIKAEATEHHPAQVEMYTEDTVVGNWTITKTSSAVSQASKNLMLEKVEKLQNAVKFAREEANNMEVAPHYVADKVLDFVFKV